MAKETRMRAKSLADWLGLGGGAVGTKSAENKVTDGRERLNIIFHRANSASRPVSRAAHIGLIESLPRPAVWGEAVNYSGASD